jgi:hypothetical protein
MIDIQATTKNKYYVLLYLESRRCRYRSIVFICFYLYVSVVNFCFHFGMRGRQEHTDMLFGDARKGEAGNILGAKALMFPASPFRVFVSLS